MDPNTVIDDIWMVIFDDVDHATLAQLSLVCHRFRDLATKPLLREVRWRDPQRALANMASWERSYSDLLGIPRKLVFGLPFRFTGFNSWGVRVPFVVVYLSYVDFIVESRGYVPV